MADKPWYRDGLPFECTQCGDCCTGAPGYVWVNNEEIAAIAAEIGEEDIERFMALYVRHVGVRKSLREYSDGACVFFDTEARKCTVYHARPRQCRLDSRDPRLVRCAAHLYPQGRSSVGERLSDAQEVGGSKPPVPTTHGSVRGVP